MKRGHDLSGVMKFATSPAWADHLRDALGDHLGLAMEEFDFEADELADIVGDHWAGVLWGCAFEDLLTRTIEPEDRNIVDDYIRRRGWNESGSTKIYLRALRSSVMSLHEVSEVEPGSGFLVRDLIQGGEPLRVSERSASQTLKQSSCAMRSLGAGFRQTPSSEARMRRISSCCASRPSRQSAALSTKAS